MNKEQAQIVADIALYIKDVPECYAFNDGRHAEDHVPICFFGNGSRADIITQEQANELAYPDNLSEVFDVSETDAYNLIFGNKGTLTGQEYYERAKVFLTKNGYKELAESI